MFVVTLQQRKGEQPGFQSNMDDIIKTLATQSTPNLLQQIRIQNTIQSKDLPSKSQCKNFLQSYPSQFCWKEYYMNTTTNISREDLVVKYDEAVVRLSANDVEGPDSSAVDSNDDSSSGSSSNNNDKYVDVLRTGLDVICYDLTHNSYNHAFERLKQLPLLSSSLDASTTTSVSIAIVNPIESIQDVTPLPSIVNDNDESKQLINVTFITPFAYPATTTESSSSLLPSSSSDSCRSISMLESLRYELIGFEYHLRCNMVAAIDAYKTSLHYMPVNIDARLKLANVYLEDGAVTIADQIFQEILEFIDSLLSMSSSLSSSSIDIYRVLKAWTLLHHSAISVTRTEAGMYVDGSITKSAVDIDAALSLLGRIIGTVSCYR